MRDSKISVLLVEDNPGDALLVSETLNDAGSSEFNLICVDRLSKGVERLIEGKIDLVLLDLNLPDSLGLDTLKKMRTQTIQIPIIVLTGYDDQALAIKAVQNGAQDYLIKGQVESELLRRSIRYAIERQRLREGIERYKQDWEDIFQSISQPTLILDPERHILTANRAALYATGKSQEELLGKSCYEVFHGSSCPHKGCPVDKLLISEASEAVEIKIGVLNGTYLISCTPMFDDSGNLKKIIHIATDITQRKEAEKQLRIAAKVFESTTEGVLVTDKKGDILSVNLSFCRATGYSEEEVIGQNPRLLKSGRHSVVFYQELWAEVEETGRWQGEIWNRRKNGEIYPEWLNISSIKEEGGGVLYYVGVFSDITEHKHDKEIIRQLVYHDPLTGLSNREQFNDRLAVSLAHAHRSKQALAVLFLNLDRLRFINDALGYSVGDQLLQNISQRISDCLQKNGIETFARLGGDEFAVLMSETDGPESAARLADEILWSFRQLWRLEDSNFLITTSIGIALYPDDGADADNLLKNAGTAMHRAKQKGGNCYQFFYPVLNANVTKRLELENDLRQALKNKELEVYYQPQVEINTGRIIGAEALLRWHHPRFGLISPADFIPLAEETGLIHSIGKWVLQEACVQNKAWQNSNLPFITVAVNLSPHQFSGENLVETVKKILEETGLDPVWLELEITENAAMQNAELSIRILQALKKMGVGISIDDFGKGYSSLNYLKLFPLQKLKIDTSFTINLTKDPLDKAIVTAIINLAHNINLSVLAEGVETEKQLSFLRQNKCDYFQGYLFSKPLTAASFEEKLKGNNSFMDSNLQSKITFETHL